MQLLAKNIIKKVSTIKLSYFPRNSRKIFENEKQGIQTLFLEKFCIGNVNGYNLEGILENFESFWQVSVNRITN